MSEQVSDLTKHLGYWLRKVSNHVSFSFARRLASRDVTVAEWALMRVLYGSNPSAPSLLAEQMGLTRGAITKLANRLIKKKFVTRQASASDGRAQTLRLTKAGERFVPELARLADENDATCFASLSREDRNTLERIMKDMDSTLGINAIPLE